MSTVDSPSAENAVQYSEPIDEQKTVADDTQPETTEKVGKVFSPGKDLAEVQAQAMIDQLEVEPQVREKFVMLIKDQLPGMIQQVTEQGTPAAQVAREDMKTLLEEMLPTAIENALEKQASAAQVTSAQVKNVQEETKASTAQVKGAHEVWQAFFQINLKKISRNDLKKLDPLFVKTHAKDKDAIHGMWVVEGLPKGEAPKIVLDKNGQHRFYPGGAHPALFENKDKNKVLDYIRRGDYLPKVAQAAPAVVAKVAQAAPAVVAKVAQAAPAVVAKVAQVVEQVPQPYLRKISRDELKRLDPVFVQTHAKNKKAIHGMWVVEGLPKGEAPKFVLDKNGQRRFYPGGAHPALFENKDKNKVLDYIRKGTYLKK